MKNRLKMREDYVSIKFRHLLQGISVTTRLDEDLRNELTEDTQEARAIT